MQPSSVAAIPLVTGDEATEPTSFTALLLPFTRSLDSLQERTPPHSWRKIEVQVTQIPAYFTPGTVHETKAEADRAPENED
jgi:hypothetical protein